MTDVDLMPEIVTLHRAALARGDSTAYLALEVMFWMERAYQASSGSETPQQEHAPCAHSQ